MGERSSFQILEIQGAVLLANEDKRGRCDVQCAMCGEVEAASRLPVQEILNARGSHGAPRRKERPGIGGCAKDAELVRTQICWQHE